MSPHKEMVPSGEGTHTRHLSRVSGDKETSIVPRGCSKSSQREVLWWVSGGSELVIEASLEQLRRVSDAFWVEMMPREKVWRQENIKSVDKNWIIELLETVTSCAF